MTRKIDTDAVINAIRLAEQGSNPDAPSAGYKLLFVKSDGVYFETSGGAVVGPLITGSSASSSFFQEGYLTLVTGTPVSVSDATGSSVYYTPYLGNHVTFADGTTITFTETQMNLTGTSANTNYDVFGYNNSGSLKLEYLAWSSNSARATNLTRTNGRYTKYGDTTRLYLGTIRIGGVATYAEDTLLHRFVWNQYNRRLKRLYKADENNHTYGTAAWRSWNNDATVRVDCVIGLPEDIVSVQLNIRLMSSADVTCIASVGLDVTNAALDNSVIVQNNDATFVRAAATTAHYPTVGYHYYQIIEMGGASGTQTFQNGYITILIFA